MLTPADPLVIVVSRAEVETGDIAPVLEILRRLTASPEASRSSFEGVDISFHGYDHDRRELFEIEQLRHYVYRLDHEFPFWLYFLSKRHLGLQCLLMCFLPPYLALEARSEHYPRLIEELLTKSWFPAMNGICDYVGMTNEENEKLTERVVRYITKGPLQ